MALLGKGMRRVRARYCPAGLVGAGLPLV